MADVWYIGDPCDLLDVYGLSERPDWHQDAACRGHQALMFSEVVEDIERALAICEPCPVVASCREASIGLRHGVWAGEYRGTNKVMIRRRRVA